MFSPVCVDVLRSPCAQISINVKEINDLPHVAAQNISLQEGNPAGVAVVLAADDPERLPSSVFITKLPSKGTLYMYDPVKKQRLEPVTQAYNPFATSFTPVIQNGATIVGVSSWWGVTEEGDYGANQILGPQVGACSQQTVCVWAEAVALCVCVCVCVLALLTSAPFSHAAHGFRTHSHTVISPQPGVHAHARAHATRMRASGIPARRWNRVSPTSSRCWL